MIIGDVQIWRHSQVHCKTSFAARSPFCSVVSWLSERTTEIDRRLIEFDFEKKSRRANIQIDSVTFIRLSNEI